MSNYISYKGSTNNDMELEASILGIEIAFSQDLTPYKKVVVVTDSKYVEQNSRNVKS